ncbi:MAG TPA: response regulator [candidate division Zixibacteria bacterium]|nr:response regulator [candidate division Zixibacteria bacterium]
MTTQRILIIDDSEVIRSLLAEYLTDLGYEVDLAVDGADGIEKALKGDYAAAFCDIHMPRKNGYQVYTEVSSVKSEMAFIMTDSLPDELAEMAEKAGAYCCLTKPFDLDQIKSTLAKVLPPVKQR